jgi:hypothetical protein
MLFLSDFDPNANNAPVVRANIGGRSYWFVVDTGMDRNLIKQSVQQEAGINSVASDPSEFSNIPDTLTTDGKVYTSKADVNMGRFGIRDVDFVVCNDDKAGNLLLREDRTIAGILGASFLKKRAVMFDYDRREMRFARTGNLGKDAVRAMGFAGSDVVVDMVEATASTLGVEAVLNGRKRLLAVDTGGASSLLLGKPEELGIDVSAAETGVARMFQGEFTTKKTQVTMKIGGLELKNVAVSLITDAEAVSGVSEGTLAGVLGRSLLMRYNFLIDFPAKKLYLRPRTDLKRDQ